MDIDAPPELQITVDERRFAVVRGHEDRVFVAHGPGGLQPRELTPQMRQALARFADLEAGHGLQRP